MTKAPKYEALLKEVEVRNPNWYPFIHGYLNGELNSLEIDNSEFDDNDIDVQRLDIGNNDACVVGESFRFKGTYKHDGFDNCFMCGEYAMRLFYNSNVPDSDEQGNDVPEIETQREIFAINLESFYKHRGFMK